MNNNEPSNEWLPLRAALTVVTPHFGSEPSAKLALAERIRDGEFRLWARRFTRGTVFPNSAHGTDKLSTTSNPPVKTNHQVWQGPGEVSGRELWSSSSFWNEDRERWRWGKGQVSFTFIDQKESATLLTVCHDLHLLRSQIDELSFSKQFISLVNASTNDNKQVKDRHSKYDWEELLVDLIAIAHFDGLDEEVLGAPLSPAGRLGEQGPLKKWLAAHMAARPPFLEPSESEVKRRSKAIIDALHRHHLRSDKKA